MEGFKVWALGFRVPTSTREVSFFAFFLGGGGGLRGFKGSFKGLKGFNGFKGFRSVGFGGGASPDFPAGFRG